LLNRVLLETNRHEEIVAEFPTEGSAAPLNGRPVIYLDQKDWSSLAKAIYRPERVQSVAERDAANGVIALARQRKIILPMSAGHMSETAKWTNNEERYQLALTIVQLSCGWQMRDPLEVRRYELRQAFTRRYKETLLEPQDVFTLEPDAIHSATRSQQDSSQSTEIPPQVAMATDALTSISASIDTMLDASPVEMPPTPGWVEKFQNFTNWLANETRSSSQRRKAIDVFFISDKGMKSLKKRVLLASL